VPFEGPQWIIYFQEKIQSSILNKAEQIKDYTPAIIVICDQVFNFPDIPKHLQNIKESIQHSVSSMPHISGVMLVFDQTSMWELKEWSIDKTNLLVVQFLLCDNTRLLSKLLIPNLAAYEALTSAEIDTLLVYPDLK